MMRKISEHADDEVVRRAVDVGLSLNSREKDLLSVCEDTFFSFLVINPLSIDR